VALTLVKSDEIRDAMTTLKDACICNNPKNVDKNHIIQNRIIAEELKIFTPFS